MMIIILTVIIIIIIIILDRLLKRKTFKMGGQAKQQLIWKCNLGLNYFTIMHFFFSHQ